MEEISLKGKIKEIIEANPLVLATVMLENYPNIIAVAAAKVVGDNEIIITDNKMHQTLTDIKSNPHVALIMWDPKTLSGYKLIGTASYYSSGIWHDFVKSLPENEGYPTKGAIHIQISQIITVNGN
jgi:uncharacterized protein